MPSSTYCAQYKANLRWSAIRWVRKRTTALECGRRYAKIVASAFDEDEFEAGKGVLEVSDRLQIHGGVFADGRMRASSGFDPQHAIGGKRTLAH